ncbi:MAG: response regulator [Bdellovibrionaceae bacterium]|nr:response regulator [Pseudobdellovibrionaceae bacterium]
MQLDEMGSDQFGDVVDILIVDDREDGLLALEAVIARPGIRVVKATSGVRALELLADFQFAIVLLDVQMPGMDGFETARRLRLHERYGTTPLIFVTAINKDDAYVYRGYELGAVDYIFKPFDPYALRSKVDVFVELHRKNRQLERQADLIRQSERRERYLRLAELEVEGLRRYRGLADAIPHIIWKTSPDGLIEYVNAVWTQYTGLDFESSLGSTWQKALHPDDLRVLLKKWLMAMEHADSFESECRIRRFDGEYRWFLIRAVPELRGSNLHGWIGTSTDIHDRTVAEQDLKEARAIAEEASRAKTYFLANMSHEIRTPLNAILGFSELLLGENQSQEDSERHVSTIRRSGRQLLGIIDEILDISKIEAGHLQLEMIDVDLPNVIADVRSTVELQAREKRIDLRVFFLTPIPLKLVTDPTRLRQILMNLVGNAVKFTSSGVIDLELSWRSTRPGHGIFMCKIRDSGIGISQEDAARLFQPFVQVDTSTSRRFGGTGLGLALSRNLAELLNGSVYLEESVLGKGSTFAMEIRGDAPSTAMTSSLPDESTKLRPSHDFAGLLDGVRVLVVDDSADNQMLVSRFLSAAGARVDFANNGLEGVNHATKNEYEVVLMDIQMPELDGYQATSRLRAMGFDRPIVALTAHALKEERDRCLSAGCTSHLTKPVEKRVLIEHVARLTRSGLMQ